MWAIMRWFEWSIRGVDMTFDLKNRWSLVTGASAGIGRELAGELAQAGSNLVLVARRESLLSDLATELKSAYGIEVDYHALDLSQPEAAQALVDGVTSRPVSVLVNNAGYAVLGGFEGASPEGLVNMTDLNVRFLTELSRRMLPKLLAHPDGGRILNLGSVAGHQGVPNMAAYAATKAYVNAFSEGLGWELRGTSVRVSCLQPGQTKSEFFNHSDKGHVLMARFGLLSAEKVARDGVALIRSGRSGLVVGLVNKMTIFLLRLFPRWVIGRAVGLLFKDMA